MNIKQSVGTWVDRHVMPVLNNGKSLKLTEQEMLDQENAPQYLDALTEMKSRYRRILKLEILPDVSSRSQDQPDYFQFFMNNSYVGTIKDTGIIELYDGLEKAISHKYNELIVENVLKEGVMKLYHKAGITINKNVN